MRVWVAGEAAALGFAVALAALLMPATLLPRLAASQEPEHSLALVPLTAAVQWDAQVEVDVLLANRSPVEVPFPLGETARAKLSTDGDSWLVILTRDSNSNGVAPAQIPPGGFVAVRYHGAVPAQAHGRAVLELDEPGVERPRAVIDIIGGAPTGAWTGDFEHQRLLGGRLSIYRPIYFITGALSPPAKFQISLKYRIFSFGEDDSGSSPPHSLQFAYTQRSLWEFGPFYDTSYMPELLYQWSPLREDTPSAQGMTWLGLQAGWMHESNGRSDGTERQANIAYVRPIFSIGTAEGWHVKLEPQLWVYVFGLHHNPNLYDYRGNSSLTVTAGKDNGPTLALTVLPGEHFDKGSRQIDLSIPVHLPFIDFSTYILVQYFEGYAEALITYQQHTSALRAGIEVVR